MTVKISRYYGREKLELDCEIITPMFLGNAHQEAELRTAPFKGLLRYWWRVANGMKYEKPKTLLKQENEIFGSPDEDTGGKSQVKLEVKGDPECFSAGNFPSGQSIKHPEVRNRGGNPIAVDRFLYLGYGPIHQGGQLKAEGKGALMPEQQFTLVLSARNDVLQSILTTLQCWQHFGAVGGRSRNGWGSFSISFKDLSFTNLLPEIHISVQELFHKIGCSWQECFASDYPHSLGLDGNRPLYWRCNNKHSDWQGVMNELAEVYLNLRLEHKFQGGGPHPRPQDRYILGYPTGNKHKVNDWGSGRHGSPLRLIAGKEEENLRGYILHLPHLFSQDMWKNDKDRQIEIWQKIHARLDQLCERVELEEAGV